MTLERVPANNGVPRWIHTAAPAAEIAERVAGTDFVPRAMRGNAPAVAACIMYGDEIGVPPMTALQGIHVIDGRPFLSAELMRALVVSAGHRIRVMESTGTRCVVLGWRREDAPFTAENAARVEWTIEMARAAGLAGKGAWRSYPRALLVARASADLCRMAFPDVVRGLGHIPEAPEVTDVSDWAEYAETLGPEPEAPAPARTETVQWSPRELLVQHAPEPPEPATDPPPPAGPDYPPWEEQPAEAPAAVTPEPVAVEEPYRGAGHVLAETETPTAESPEARLVPAQQITRIMAAYGDLTYGPDRDTRLSLFSAIVGRPIESTKELERMEAFRLLGGLHDLRTGRTVAVDDGHGVFTVHAGAEPDDDE